MTWSPDIIGSANTYMLCPRLDTKSPLGRFSSMTVGSKGAEAASCGMLDDTATGATLVSYTPIPAMRSSVENLSIVLCTDEVEYDLNDGEMLSERLSASNCVRDCMRAVRSSCS